MTGLSGQDLQGGFECLVEHGAEEGGELEIAATCAGNGVDWGLRVGMRAACVGKLGAIAGFVVVEECAGFFRGVVVRDAAELAMETFFGKERFLLGG